MATRQFPISAFGKIPELDNLLKRRDHASYVLKDGDGVTVKGLTPARLAAAKAAGLQEKYTEASLSVERPWPDRIKRNGAAKSATKKQSKQTSAAKPTGNKAAAKKMAQQITESATARKAGKIANQVGGVKQAHLPMQQIDHPLAPFPDSVLAPVTRDMFDSANRIFMRVPISADLPPAELSFPRNANTKDLAATLAILKELNPKK